MVRGRMVLSLCVAVALIAGLGCGAPTKHDILQKAEDVQTKEQLLDALGEPDERSKTAFVETWRYEASDGTVVFTITGDRVMLKNTSESSDQQ